MSKPKKKRMWKIGEFERVMVTDFRQHVNIPPELYAEDIELFARLKEKK